MTIIYISIHPPNMVWTIISAAKCLGEYLLVISSSLFSGHCPANHFQCVNSPAAFSGSTHMMHKTVRTCCLNKNIISTTVAILIPFTTAFRQNILCAALESKVLLAYFMICKLGSRKMNWLAQGDMESIGEMGTQTISAWLNWIPKIL